MAQIFICYAREDFQRAQDLYKKLAEHGFNPWMDKIDLLAGQKWRPAIEKAIHNADFFLLLLSRHSIKKRGFVQREIKAAFDFWQDKLADDIYLIPIMLEALQWSEAPDEISQFQWVEFYSPTGWEQLIKALEYEATRRGIVIVPADTNPPVVIAELLPANVTQSQSNQAETTPAPTASISRPAEPQTEPYLNEMTKLIVQAEQNQLDDVPSQQSTTQIPLPHAPMSLHRLSQLPISLRIFVLLSSLLAIWGSYRFLNALSPMPF